MSVIANNIIAGAAGQGGADAAYQIDRSVRLNSADSAHFSRTPSSAGNRKTFTFSTWVKRCNLGSNQAIFTARVGTSNSRDSLRFESNDRLLFDINDLTQATVRTEAVFRDPSAWYHIVIAVDTTQSTAADRVSIYVNGDEVTDFNASSYPSQNLDCNFNSAQPHGIGLHIAAAQQYLDAYLADIHFIDGVSGLSASDFGEYDSNNVWQPKAYSGTYGTNGFHLDFSDNSSNAALGTDAAGSNDWTVNNLSASNFSGSYLSLTSATGTGGVSGISSTYPLSNLYDGDTATYVSTNFANIASNPAILTLTFSPGIPFSSTVRARSYKGTGETVTYNFNGEGSNSWSSTGVDWQTVKSGSGVMTSLVITRQKTNTNGGSVECYGLEVDGVLLTGNLSLETDSFVDSPTNGTQTDTGAGGEVVGNYCTLNPLAIDPVYALPTLSDGNLTAVASSSGSFATITFGLTSGKYYWEFTCGSSVSSGSTSRPASGFNEVREVNSTAFAWRQNGNTMGLSGSPTFSTYQTGDTIGIALDIDNTQVTFYKNGVQQGSGAYSYTNTDDIVYIGLFSADNGGTYHYNFGQRPFAYTAPSGYKALCTANLPDPTIADGSTYFDTKLYTGNGSSQTISGLNFSPDFLWFKSISSTRAHHLIDVVRGASKRLFSNFGSAEDSTVVLSSFDSNGFSVTAANGSDGINATNDPMVAWAWDGGTSNATNTDGSITSTVRANPSAGFSIVSYTGNATNATVGHGLSSAPKFIIVKNRDSSSDWYCYHAGLGNTKYVYLNRNDTANTYSLWQNTSPTGSVFSINNGNDVNKSGDGFIAYCFAPVDGYSSFGSYTGNGSADGPFVYTGHRSKWILLRNTNYSGASWVIIDTARESYNVTKLRLMPNTSQAEINSSQILDITSNGFKVRDTDTYWNGSGNSIIYACFSENPFKTARAR